MYNFIVGFILLRMQIFLLFLPDLCHFPVPNGSNTWKLRYILKRDIKQLVENYLNSPKITNDTNGFSRFAYEVFN